jgi:hypothetical protein
MKCKPMLKVIIVIGILMGMFTLTSGYQFVDGVSAAHVEVLVQRDSNSSGRPTDLLAPDSDWLPLGPGLDDTVRAIAVSGTDVYVGGGFTNAGGIEEADYIARWDGSSWHALGSGLTGSVEAIAVSGSNVYVGGRFVTAGGNANCVKIARWDGSTWHAVGGGLSKTNTVYAIAVSGSDVYIGGDFANAGGIQEADRIVRWDGSNWHALGNGLTHELGASCVYAIAVSGSNVYAGGNFTDAGGDSDADYIARWDGSNWHALGSGIHTYPSSVMAIAAEGTDIYVGGTFVNAGDNEDADKFARWDGSAWYAVGNSSPLSSVYAISIEGDEIYIGGFGSGNGFKYWDGSSWKILGSGLSYTPSIWAVAYDDTFIYAGGAFTDAGGDANGDRIARFAKENLPIDYFIYLPLVVKAD